MKPQQIEIHGTINNPITIDILDVIDSLIYKFLGSARNWVEQKDNKYYIMENKHNMDYSIEEITKSEYDYYMSLLQIKEYTQNKQDGKK